MKPIDEMTVAELREFAMVHVGDEKLKDAISEIEDAYVKEAIRDFQVEIHPDMVALATGADKGTLVEERRLRKLVDSLTNSLPVPVLDELKIRMGDHGIALFRAKIQKLFLQMIALPAWSKFDPTSPTSDDLSQRAIDATIEKTAVKFTEADVFNVFEGTKPLSESAEEKK